jgi:hypothetical protein
MNGKDLKSVVAISRNYQGIHLGGQKTSNLWSIIKKMILELRYFSYLKPAATSSTTKNSFS